MLPFCGWDSTALRLQSHYEETFYFLPLNPQNLLVLIWSTSEDWKAELTLEPSSGLTTKPLFHKWCPAAVRTTFWPNFYLTLNTKQWLWNMSNLSFCRSWVTLWVLRANEISGVIKFIENLSSMGSGKSEKLWKLQKWSFSVEKSEFTRTFTFWW